MIHDGLAENGHYYSYIYDRVLKVWWKLDDHRVSQVEEETVMKEAFGGEGYKSACNLFYISAHVSQIIENRKMPLFNTQRANELMIRPSISSEIKQSNLMFEDQLNKFTYQKKVEQISKEFTAR